MKSFLIPPLFSPVSCPLLNVTPPSGTLGRFTQCLWWQLFYLSYSLISHLPPSYQSLTFSKIQTVPYSTCHMNQKSSGCIASFSLYIHTYPGCTEPPHIHLKLFLLSSQTHRDSVTFYGSFLSQLLPTWLFKNYCRGFPGGAVVENLPANAGDTGSSPDLGRSHMPRSN